MQCAKKGSVGNTLLLPRAKCCLFQLIFTLVGRLCSGGFYVFTEQMCIIFVTCFILKHAYWFSAGCFWSARFALWWRRCISHNNRNRNSLRASSPFNASVESNCAHPLPRLTSRALAFFVLDGKFPGHGTLKLPNPPLWGRKKRANARSSSLIHTAVFIDRLSNSAVLIISNVSANVCLRNSAILIKLWQNHSWFLVYHCYLSCYKIVPRQRKVP